MAPISVGELLDKISILEIKQFFARKDTAKLANIENELALLRELYIVDSSLIESLYKDLKRINKVLWHLEDYKRNCEKDQEFGSDFVNAARQVYISNDERSRIKREINQITNSHIIEEKLYQ
jgi:Family of unknown function (DUF6165)